MFGWAAEVLHHHFSKTTGGGREPPLPYIKTLKTLTTSDCCWIISISRVLLALMWVKWWIKESWLLCLMQKGIKKQVLTEARLTPQMKDNQQKDNIATLLHGVSFIFFFMEWKHIVLAHMERQSFLFWSSHFCRTKFKLIKGVLRWIRG